MCRKVPSVSRHPHFPTSSDQHPRVSVDTPRSQVRVLHSSHLFVFLYLFLSISDCITLGKMFLSLGEVLTEIMFCFDCQLSSFIELKLSQLETINFLWN